MNSIDESSGLDSRYICFRLNDERFGIPLLQIKEVIGNIKVTPVPKSPNYFKGLMNLRGKVIPVIDLRIKLGVTTNKSNDQLAIIILDNTPNSVAIIVDSIDSVMTFKRENIDTANDSEITAVSEHILGIAKEESSLTVLLHLEKILNIEFACKGTISLAA